MRPLVLIVGIFLKIICRDTAALDGDMEVALPITYDGVELLPTSINRDCISRYACVSGAPTEVRHGFGERVERSVERVSPGGEERSVRNALLPRLPDRPERNPLERWSEHRVGLLEDTAGEVLLRFRA